MFAEQRANSRVFGVLCVFVTLVLRHTATRIHLVAKFEQKSSENKERVQIDGIFSHLIIFKGITCYHCCAMNAACYIVVEFLFQNCEYIFISSNTKAECRLRGVCITRWSRANTIFHFTQNARDFSWSIVVDSERTAMRMYHITLKAAATIDDTNKYINLFSLTRMCVRVCACRGPIRSREHREQQYIVSHSKRSYVPDVLLCTRACIGIILWVCRIALTTAPRGGATTAQHAIIVTTIIIINSFFHFDMRLEMITIRFTRVVHRWTTQHPSRWTRNRNR